MNVYQVEIFTIMRLFSYKFLLTLLLASFCKFSNAEYIVYLKQSGRRTQLSKELHLKIYETLMKYQFPMSARITQNLKKELPENEFNLLCHDERKFIENMCKKINPNLRVEFIPTTLYELLYAKFLTEQIVNYQNRKTKNEKKLNNNASIEELENHIKQKQKNLIPLIYHDIQGLESSYAVEVESKKQHEKYLHNIYKSEIDNIYDSARNIHLKLNNIIIQYFSRTKTVNPINILNKELNNIYTCMSKIKRIKNKKIHWTYPDPFYLRPSVAFSDEGKFSKDLFKILKKAIDAEIEANYKGCFVIYRGTKDFVIKEKDKIGHLDEIVMLKSKHFPGISYGNSLLGGCINDPGATALQCIKKYKYKLGYALLIDKNQYFKKDSYINSILTIPCLPTFVGLVSLGEYFHPRIFGSESSNEKKFQEYLGKHARIVKNTSDIKNNKFLKTS